MAYVYHFVKHPIKGDVLYPLNELKNRIPEVYQESVKKYEGREGVMDLKLPILDCLWNDVLHLSPLHTQKTLNALKQHGLRDQGSSGFSVYKIPVEMLREEATIYFDPDCLLGDFGFGQNRPPAAPPGSTEHMAHLEPYVKPFSCRSYRELDGVSEKQIERWKKHHAEGRRLLVYNRTMHVLYRGHIDISDVEVEYCQ